MSSFAKLKNNMEDIDRINKEIEKINNPVKEKPKDERFWQPELDKSGNGIAVIRFLPPPAADGDDALPWVRIWNYGFKGPTGKWYIENSLTTLNQKDPVTEYNSTLWGDSSNKDPGYRVEERKQASRQKRRLTYISNILVISDPKNPENEGNVFLFRYGKKIFDKISLLMHPEFEEDKPVNPFNLWTGANFRLKIRTVEGYRNYDQSAFATPSPLSDDDAYLEKIYNSEYSLKEFLDPKNFKSYDELKRRLEDVLELNSGFSSATKSENVARPVATESDTHMIDVDDDEDLAAFKSLVD